LDYVYEANKEGVAEKIVEMAINGSGIRDTGRVLGISATTVIARLKNFRHRQSRRLNSTNSVKK
jgi:transposase-like protein